MPSEIHGDFPPQCSITFAQILSGHGACDPTASKTRSYNATIQALQATVINFTRPTAFLTSYEITLGADQLILCGEQEMINSGVKFYSRHGSLADHLTPFARSPGEARFVKSAQKWMQGFHAAKLADHRAGSSDSAYSYPLLSIPEDHGVNKILNHGLCNAFENSLDHDIPDERSGDLGFDVRTSNPTSAQRRHPRCKLVNHPDDRC